MTTKQIWQEHCQDFQARFLNKLLASFFYQEAQALDRVNVQGGERAVLMLVDLKSAVSVSGVWINRLTDGARDKIND